MNAGENENSGKKKNISPEKKKQYEKAIKDKFAAERERRKAADDKTPERLKFLYKIFGWMGLTYRDAAELCGSSAQNVIYHMTITDDGKLSWVEKILTSLGLSYRISFEDMSYINNDEIQNAEGQAYNCSLNDGATNLKAFILPMQNTGKRIYRYKNVNIPQEIMNCYQNNGRMKFLAELYISMNMTQTAFCEKANIKPMNLWNVFKSDDIQISVLQSICNNLGKTINWEVEPIKK